MKKQANFLPETGKKMPTSDHRQQNVKRLFVKEKKMMMNRIFNP
jgi:hypothetical protein